MGNPEAWLAAALRHVPRTSGGSADLDRTDTES